MDKNKKTNKQKQSSIFDFLVPVNDADKQNQSVASTRVAQKPVSKRFVYYAIKRHVMGDWDTPETPSMNALSKKQKHSGQVKDVRLCDTVFGGAMYASVAQSQFMWVNKTQIKCRCCSTLVVRMTKSRRLFSIG
jgi:hypothetical protein